MRINLEENSGIEKEKEKSDSRWEIIKEVLETYNEQKEGTNGKYIKD